MIRFLVLQGVIVFFVLITSSYADDDSITIHFYSQEVNSTHYKEIKIEFDTYLSKFGHYKFQPYTNNTVFEENLSGKKRFLVMLSSRYYMKIHKQYRLVPLLAAVINGNKFQKSIFVTRSKSSDINSILRDMIASPMNEKDAISELMDMLGRNQSFSEVNLLTVPKDIDALISVHFGIAQSALIMNNPFITFKNLQPNMCKNIVVFAQGKETLSLILAAPDSFVNESESVVSIIENMPKSEKGNQSLGLGIEAWEKLESNDYSIK
ncbi:MAG: hypothetical protein HQK77_17555 [Desulfobacterales bacterium]|nr:hypothetical protein [Desulfobacterales bacterium]